MTASPAPRPLAAPASGPVRGGPFDLADDDAYRRWRDHKLAGYPADVGDLVVEVADLAALTPAEHGALLARLRKTNMAVYAARRGGGEDKAVHRGVAARFGLARLDNNLCADDDGITPLRVIQDGRRVRYIPYTDRPIKWHTDGYYNTPDMWIRAMVLHCVRPAAEGGVNALLDHELAYIALRDRDPALVAALMHPMAMTIPPNDEGDNRIRGARTNPVFAVDAATGALLMNFSERKRNLVWRDDADTARAVAALADILHGDTPGIFRHRLAAGQGLVCNNVLHDRSGFADSDDGPGRLLFRGRYADRVAGTALSDTWPEEDRR
ncbi:MAG: TauD/TfdA family dioxygenase [Rhodobacterales bacterium]|nr:TauD/TfdA family dioxygenase [Rhodobacterales bacterium]